jgi:hypothetical protein
MRFHLGYWLENYFPRKAILELKEFNEEKLVIELLLRLSVLRN